MLDKNIFKNSSHNKLYEFILKSQNLGKEIKIGDVFIAFDTQKDEGIKDIINYNFDAINNTEKYFRECVKNLQLEVLLKKQQDIIAQIQNTDVKEQKILLMQKLSELTKQINIQKKTN